MGLADEILARWAPALRRVEVVPGTRGVFELRLNGALMFAIDGKDRFPGPVELANLLEGDIGPALSWRADTRYRATRRVKRALKIGPFKKP